MESIGPDQCMICRGLVNSKAKPRQSCWWLAERVRKLEATARTRFQFQAKEAKNTRMSRIFTLGLFPVYLLCGATAVPVPK
jgi:hypothetical protein